MNNTPDPLLHHDAEPRPFSRMDTSFLGAWWWTVDKVFLACILFIMAMGVVLVATASPSVATRIGVDDFHFLKKHLVFFVPSVFFLVGMSLLSRRYIWRISSLIFVGTIGLLVLVLLMGQEVKGASRWINFLGFSIQPSEFLKPSFAVVSAWLIALGHKDNQEKPQLVNGFSITIALYVCCIALLLMQPDLGMSVVLTCIFASQILLVGLRFRYLALLAGAGVGALGGAYMTLHHVRSRIDRFLYPDSGDNYQVERSLEAIKKGGVLGVGPGQGEEKMNLPDAHADFIFSVLAEEMGLIFSLILIGVFLLVILRGFQRLKDIEDMFSILAVGGLLVMFGIQSLIHMGSAANILPAKGMTLPFMSYGGSSILSMSLSMGMILALTRHKQNRPISKTSITMKRTQQ